MIYVSKLYTFLAVYSSIVRSNSLSIVDLIICPLGYFSLVVFVVGCTLFRWSATAKNFTLHPELEMAEFSSFVSWFFFWLDLNQD